METMKPGISLCMIVRDEQEFMEECLLSVKGIADEILIADTGSVDDTKEIARLCGAQVYDYPWNFSFSHARNFIMGKAAYEWVLLLDADERLFTQDGEKLLEFVKGSGFDGAHFKVYNYVGSYGEGQYTLHNALRLVRNNGLYRFAGDIHEQIMRIDEEPMDGLFAVTDIRLHHLGYLESVVSKKNKRERNIPLLLAELDKDPVNAFMLFNLGNEYMAKKEYGKALECYEKSKTFYKAQEAFGPHLFFRTALCHYNTQRLLKAVETLAEGLLIYPGCTDMEYLRGRVYMDLHRDFAAAESFQKAIDMGQPHATLRFSDDCATTKPLMSLAELNMRQHEYHKAAIYYTKAIQADNNLHAALYGMAKAYKKMGYAPADIEKRITSLFATPGHLPNRIMTADILLSQGLWEQSLTQLSFLNEAGEAFLGEVSLLWGKYYLLAGDFDKALESLSKSVSCAGAGSVLARTAKESAMMQFALLLMHKPGRTDVMDEAVDAIGRAFGEMGRLLCGQVLIVLSSGQEDLLHGQEPAGLMVFFSVLLRIILECGAFDLFERVLYVYNYVDSRNVLISLAQLYMECGFPQLAGQTVLRSIKELDAIDDFGAQVLLDSLVYQRAQGNGSSIDIKNAKI